MKLIIAIIIIICVLAFYFGLLIWHCPRKKITEEIRRAIKEYGLIHFCFRDKAEAIVHNGLLPNNERRMSKLENDMVWTYINYPGSFNDNLHNVRSKGARKDYDAAVLIRGLSDDQIDHMLQLCKTNVVVHVGVLRTDDMTAQSISQ